MIIIYCDDPPIESHGGFGPILDSIRQNDSEFALLVGRPGLKGSEKLIGLNLTSILFQRSKWVSMFFLALDFFKMQFSGVRNGSDHYVGFIGGSFRSFIRCCFVFYKRKVELPVFYFVDDCFSSNRFLKKIIMRWLLSRFTEVKIFTISRGLKIYLEDFASQEVNQICLPFSFKRSNSLLCQKLSSNDPKVRNIVFIGSLNEYTLPIIFWFIDLLNDDVGNLENTYYLQLVSNTSKFNDLIESNFRSSFHLLKIRNGLSDSDVFSEFTTSNSLFIVGYSFGVHHSQFVRMSWPSKLLKLILYRSNILLLAPEESELFRSHGKYFMYLDNLPSLKNLDCIFNSVRSFEVDWDTVEGLHSIEGFKQRIISYE
jgi:hypothetical protein